MIGIGPIIGQIDLKKSSVIILSTFTVKGKYFYELIPDNTNCSVITEKLCAEQIKIPIKTTIRHLCLDKTNYTLNLLNSEKVVIAQGIGRVRITARHKIAFTSGNNYKLAENTNMWTGVLGDPDVDLVIMMGNNVYADGVFYQLLNELNSKTNINIDEIVDNALSAYHDLYYENWVTNPIIQQIMSTTSTLMIQENHDVFSLWGTGKIPHGYDRDTFSIALKIARTIINKYQRNLIHEWSFPSDRNYYFKHTWGNIALFCNEFRNGTRVELDCSQASEMLKFAKKSKSKKIKSFISISPTFLLPTNDNIIHSNNPSQLINIFARSISNAPMTSNTSSFYFNTIFKIKKLYDDISIICGNSNIFMEGNIVMNGNSCVPFYSSSPIMMMPINLSYPLINNGSGEGIPIEKQIGSYCDNTFVFRGDYYNVRNYIAGYYDADSMCVIVEKNLGSSTNISDGEALTEFIMDIGNIHSGSLSEPIGVNDRINYIRSQMITCDMLSASIDTLFN